MLNVQIAVFALYIRWLAFDKWSQGWPVSPSVFHHGNEPGFGDTELVARQETHQNMSQTE